MAGSGLSARNMDVLKAVVSTFIETGEPVGSRTLSKKGAISFSPATIRNIMSDLADEGFLTKPHPSAGRMPTDLGYRVFVDNLSSVPEVTQEEQESIRRSYSQRAAKIEQVLTEASRILSGLTQQAGIILLPGGEQLQFQYIEFIRLAERKVLAVIVAKSGVVQNRIALTEEDIPQEELHRISRMLNDEFSDLSLRDIRTKILEQMKADTEGIDQLRRRAFFLSEQAFIGRGEDSANEPTVYVESASRIFAQPDFAGDMEKVQTLFRAFEEKEKLVHLLDGCMKSQGLTVLIGSESEMESMQDCSLVVQNYFMGDRPLGTIGIIGPKRMRYDRAVALVEWTANAVSEYLSSGEV